MSQTKVEAPFVANNANFRNLFINGDMSIAQRATSATGLTGSSYPTIDRMAMQAASAGTWTQSQSTDVPTGEGFATSLKMDCTTANGSLSSGSYLIIDQRFEGQMLQHLKKGTSNSQKVTLSFFVKSAKTGTYIVNVRDDDNSRSISKSYTISSADTWEKKVIVFDADTSGALDNDNAQSFAVLFFLAAGSDRSSGTLATSWESLTNANRAVGQVNLADSTDNDWYLTGVQLEVGDQATDFEHLPFDIQLRRCQRYLYRTPDGGDSGTSSTYQHLGMGYMHASTNFIGHLVFPVVMRANPTVTFAGEVQVLDTNGARDPGSNISFEQPTSRSVQPQMTISGATAGHGAAFRYHNDSDAYIQADAEL